MAKLLILWLVWGGILLGGGYLVYYLVSLPARRMERAGLFLDLLETALARGGRLEANLIELGNLRDRSLSMRFHLLAAHLERGTTLTEALEHVPRLVPPPIREMLKTGVETGQLERALHSSRKVLGDAHSQLDKAQHYVLTLSFLVTPLVMWTMWFTAVAVMPKFEAISADMLVVPYGGADPNPWALVRSAQGLWLSVSVFLLVLFPCGIFFYLGGPRTMGWVNGWFPHLADSIMLRLPWRRRRMQRDFAGMLAVLLDAGLSEEKAVTQAAQATANAAFADRAGRVVADLHQGVKLTEAVRHLDAAGEFRWRLDSAAHGSRVPLGAASAGEFGRLRSPHPDPLPEEREQPQGRPERAHGWRAEGRAPLLPLPQGEGRGEGEGDGRRAGDGHFTRALAGWQESLDAQAFQQEQAATHLITTAMVIWNGLIVGATAWCVFKFLSDLMWEGILW